MSWSARRFENAKQTAASGGQLGLHSQWQSQHGSRSMTDGRAPNDWNADGPQNASRDILHDFPARRWIAFREFAENDAGNPAKLAGLLEMHQCAIDLIRFHASIFEHE